MNGWMNGKIELNGCKGENHLKNGLWIVLLFIQFIHSTFH